MDILEIIKTLVQKGNYALRPHVVTHMMSEGFDESNIIESIENAKLLENYADEGRCLIAGTFRVTMKTREYLHVVVDYWSETDEMAWVDIVTAYIPHRPWWQKPYRRGTLK